jgi:hypothetical protein
VPVPCSLAPPAPFPRPRARWSPRPRYPSLRRRDRALRAASMSVIAVSASTSTSRSRIGRVQAVKECQRRDATLEQVLDQLAVGDALLGKHLILDEECALVDVDGDLIEPDLAQLSDCRNQLREGLCDQGVGRRIETRVSVRDRQRPDELLGSGETRGRGEWRPVGCLAEFGGDLGRGLEVLGNPIGVSHVASTPHLSVRRTPGAPRHGWPGSAAPCSCVRTRTSCGTIVRAPGVPRGNRWTQGTLSLPS